MKLVAHGVSRQEAHEQIRVLSREAVDTVKTKGSKNDLIERIKKSDFFVSQSRGPMACEEVLIRPDLSNQHIHIYTGSHLARYRQYARPEAVYWPFR